MCTKNDKTTGGVEHKSELTGWESELRSAYQTMGRIAELNDKIIPWVLKQKDLPEEIAVSATELMSWVLNVKP